MNKVVKILMRRDGITREAAEEEVARTREMILNCGGCFEEASEIIADELGLEPDYIMDILGYI